MSLALGVVALSLVSAAGPAEKLSDDRMLLCRPVVLGDQGQLQTGALSEAAKGFGRLFIDYGAPCEQPEEAMNAARRAGVRKSVRSTAEVRGAAGHYVLTLSDAVSAKNVGTREVDVPLNKSAVQPLQNALRDLVDLSPETGRQGDKKYAWYVSGAGAAVMAVGVVLAIAAGSAASSRDSAASTNDYVQSDARWRKLRTMSGVTLGIGGAALAGGLVWRYAF